MEDSLTARQFIFSEKYRSTIDPDKYAEFLESVCNQPDLKYVVFTLPAAWDELLDRADSVATKNEFFYYWEKPSDAFAIAAGGTAAEIRESGARRFEDTYTAIENIKYQTAHFNAGQTDSAAVHFVGGFSFSDEVNEEQWKAFGAASFVLPKRIIIKKERNTTLSIALALGANCSPEALHRQFTAELKHIDRDTLKKDEVSAAKKHSAPSADNHYAQWNKIIAEAKREIASNRMDKVVLGRQLKLANYNGYTPVQILRYLRTQYPKCCSFLIKKEGSSAFVGCSPEKLLSFQDNSIHTEALAGSIARGTDTKEDVEYKNILLESPKNNREHHYVVQSIKQDLSPFVGELHYRQKPVIKKLANVQHLYTPIRGTIEKDVNPLKILGQLHPTPAVGGYPRAQAVDYIRTHEPFNRGWFASPVGWINTEGAGEFTVAIRSGLINKETALLFAGCGIVADSDPETEWQETNLKFMPMLSALNYD